MPTLRIREKLLVRGLLRLLEGVVAKRLSERYRPGERSWVKAKNREYWRYPLEVAAMQRV